MYALILTIYMFGEGTQRPVSVTQSSTVGFTSKQACKNAGDVAIAGAYMGSPQKVVTVYQCAPLSV